MKKKILLIFGLIIFLGCAKKPLVTVAPPVEEVPTVEEKEKPAKKVEMQKTPTIEEMPPVSGITEEKITEEKISAEELIRKQLAEEIKRFEAEDIHFDFDKYNIRPDAAEILKKKAEWLLKNPQVHILIEGHCDERGTEEYNLALGERRANSAKRFLVNLGVDPERISIISYGEERPLDPRHCEEAWARNRRCHFIVIKY